MTGKRLHHACSKRSNVATVLCTVALVLSLVLPSTLPSKMVNAYAASSNTVTVTTGDSVYYAGYSTLYAEANGVPIFCAEPGKTSITGGQSYAYTTTWNTIDESAGHYGAIEKKYLIGALYYGYGGPGYDESIWPNKWSDGSAMTQERFYALTHLMVSYLYARSFGAALEGTDEGFAPWLIDNVICNYSTGQGVSESNTRYIIQKKVDAGLVPAWFADTVYMIAGTTNRQTYFGYLPAGVLDLQKSSSNTAVTDNNSHYSLKGASYGVYASKSDAEAGHGALATLTTDKLGSATSGALEPATYYLREKEASPGYKVDTKTYSATVKRGETTVVETKEVPMMGYLDLKKASSNTAISNKNGCYSVKGAVYGVYTTKACDTLATYPDSGKKAQLSTDADGYVKSDALPLGTYYVKEISASGGYALDTKVYTVTIEDESTVRVNGKTVPEAPQNNPLGIVLEKYDDELTYNEEANLPQGAASLKGAEFSVCYYDGLFATADEAIASGEATRSWLFATDEEGHVELSTDYLVAGDNLYLDAHREPCFPLGTYLIQETKAPSGYLLNGDIFVCQVTSSGTAEAVHTYIAPTVADAVKRGDIEFTKRDGNNGRLMSGIPFSIESLTTHERHIAVTDENGYFSSSATYNPHTVSSNANDAAVIWNDDDTYTVDSNLFDVGAGIWFGMNANGETSSPDDTRCALPYDTYRIAELSCEANEGRQLVAEQIITVSRDSYTIDLGTIDDPNADISTKLVDEADGDTNIEPATEAAVIDTVIYSGLIKDRTYDVQTTLIDLSDKNTTLATEETSFTAEKAHGSLPVDITCDTSNLAGHVLAVKHSVSWQGNLVAEHNVNLDDTEQMVTVLGGAITVPTPEDTPSEEADTPEAPAPEKPARSVPSVKTGDSIIPLAIVITLALSAGAVVAACAVHKRRSAKRHASPWKSSSDTR